MVDPKETEREREREREREVTLLMMMMMMSFWNRENASRIASPKESA